MLNIKFSYLYRDAGNYKKWADVVFSNPDRLTLEAVTKALKDAFLEDGLFIAHQVRVPEVFLFSRGNATSDDHCFHEFSAVGESLEDPNDPCSRSISQLIAEVKREAKSGWVAFDPHDALLQRLSDEPELRSTSPTARTLRSSCAE
jgi:hypothetical protein